MTHMGGTGRLADLPTVRDMGTSTSDPSTTDLDRPGTGPAGADAVSQGGPLSAMSALDAVLFVFAGISAVWLAFLVLAESFELNWQILLLVVFWLLVAYLVLPRLHRVLTHLYVPNYFIGRTRTSDGLLGDPVNLALLGSGAQLHAAMTSAGWTLADEVSAASSWKIVRTTLSRRSYPEAPVSPLFLFERQQDFAYQQEVESNPSRRHHVRFWESPEGWMLPGGFHVDWLAAGTYDRSVGLSLMTFQITHRIAKDIDVERDYIVDSLTETNPSAAVHRIRHFATGYHARNGGGDEMVTDGDLPVVDLRDVRASGSSPAQPPTTRGSKRPASITFSAGVVWLRGLLGVVLAVLLVAAPGELTGLVAEAAESGAAAAAAAVVLAVFAVIDVGLGLATYYGRNWSRVVLMLFSATSIVIAFVASVNGGPRPTLGAGLPHVALGILVLLALTSPAARQFAMRSGR